MQKQHKYKNRPVVHKSFNTKDLVINMEDRKVSGYLAAFGNVDIDGEMIIKGAFAKSIRERGVNSTTDRKIAYLWQHDTSEPIGRFTELREDDYGLYYEAEIDPIPLGDRVLIQMQSGTLNQHSIGFKYVWDKTETEEIDGQEVWVLREVNLFEGSVVTIGANENTPFMGMKNDKIEEEGAVLARETEKLLKKFSPNEEYQIRQLISKHIALAESKEPQTPALGTSSEPQFDITKAINETKIIN